MDVDLCGSLSSDAPLGWLKSSTSLQDPSGFGAAPSGEMWLVGKGGCEKGPAVCPRDTSFSIALVIRALLLSADFKFFGKVGENSPVNPISKPFLRPWVM